MTSDEESQIWNPSIAGTKFEDREIFAELPALAKRLGVKSVESGTVMLIMGDGTKYSLFDLINALLDRLDAAADAREVDTVKDKP